MNTNPTNPNAKFKWEVVEDGYHRRQRYVEFPSGRIVGWVYGSQFQEASGWQASMALLDTPSIGSYVTEGLAMKAVEREVWNHGRPQRKAK